MTRTLVGTVVTGDGRTIHEPGHVVLASGRIVSVGPGRGPADGREDFGRAIVAPRDLTRRDALVVHGRLAIRLVGAAASLLVLAGIIEGFLSASDANPAFKYGVSATSAVLLLLYFIAGRRAYAAERAGVQLSEGGMTLPASEHPPHVPAGRP